MKICPRCKQAFEDSLEFCVNDGERLAAENFVLPSEVEEPTVIRHEPVVIEIPPDEMPPMYTDPPMAQPVVPVVVARPRNTWKYLLFLVAGVVIGAMLVLAATLAGIYFYRQRDEASNVAPERTATPTPRPSATKESPTPSPTPSKHAATTGDPDEDFNGRVIADGAVVRFLPNKNGTEVDRLPRGDRLDIEERAGENSPWYRVKCEHGTTGWVHGNDIEYTE